MSSPLTCRLFRRSVRWFSLTMLSAMTLFRSEPTLGTGAGQTASMKLQCEQPERSH